MHRATPFFVTPLVLQHITNGQTKIPPASEAAVNPAACCSSPTTATTTTTTINNNDNKSGSCCSAGGSHMLAPLPHPTQLDACTFGSEEWRRAMCQLYRAIFKLHVSRLLPIQREFGDSFVQTEFHRHVDATEKHSRIFYQSWYGYVSQLEVGETSREMRETELQQLTPTQKEKLRELRSHVMRVRQTDSDFML